MKKNVLKTEAFKCIIVLLLIMTIAGGLLAVLNDVLAVSDQERLNRAVQKVYGKQVDATEIENEFSCDKGVIESTYAFDDEGNHYLLFKSTGNEGYKNGTVTLWILVSCTDNPVENQTIVKSNAEKLQKVVLDGYDKQTLMSALTGEFYGAYAELDINEIKSGKLVTVNKTDNDFTNVISGATKSSNAANNAVNTVLLYLWGANV